METYAIINNDIDAEVIVKDSKGNEVDLWLETIVNRRLRTGLEPAGMFVILNKYIEHKGKDFRDKLFRLNAEGKNTIMPYLNKDTDIVPFKVVHDILDMFNINDVKDFIKKSGLVTSPTTLPDVYDINIEIDERGSRSQTYLKEDYYDLIALITILKATIGLVGEYASVRDTVLSKTTYKEYILLNFYRSHPIFNTDPFAKLHSSINKLVNRLFKDTEKTAVRIIDTGLSKENMPLHILALVTIQKLLVNDELTDDDTKHTVTKIYSYASDKLKLKDNNNSKYRIKYFSEEETDGSESESILESYRKNSDITPGHVEEFESNISDMYHMARFINIKASDKELATLRHAMEELDDKLPIYPCAVMASWVLKGVVDVRSLKHLSLKSIINIITLATMWCIENDNEDMALVLSCYSIESDTTRVNFSLRNKITVEYKEKLKELFPYEKVAVINGSLSTINFVEETLNNISKKLMGYRMVSVLPDELLEKITGSNLRSIKVPEAIRTISAKYVVDIEKKYRERLKVRASILEELGFNV